MDEQKVMEIIDQCSELTKLRDADRNLRHERRAFLDLGYEVRTVSDLGELDDEQGDEILKKLVAQAEDMKKELLRSKITKAKEQY